MTVIYKITTPENSIYIGQSKDLKKRIYFHKNTRDGKGRNKHLIDSFDRYGFEAHLFNVIASLPDNSTQDIIDENERFYIDAYLKLGFDVLNIREGGIRGRHSKETVLIMKEKRQFQIFTPEARKNMSNSNKERIRTVTWNRNISNGQQSLRDSGWLGHFKPVIQLSKDGIEIARFNTGTDAAKSVGIVETAISNCLTGRSKSSGGFKWKYA